MSYGSIYLNRTWRTGHTILDRHRHVGSYLALVLSGGYEEAGDRGCFRVTAGDVLLHTAYEAHTNRYNSSGAEVLDLALPLWAKFDHAAARIIDPDIIARIAERDPKQALELVLTRMQSADRQVIDWPHCLATAIECDPHLRLDTWAHEHNLAAATLSRGFRKVFGVTPNGFRAQQRARRAVRLAAGSRHTLRQVALDCGFADQAHMTRAVRALSGRPPGAWRTSTHVK